MTPSKLPEKKASDGSDPEDVDDEEESMREVEASVTLPTGGVGSPANFLNTENNKKQRVGNEGGASSGVSG